MRIIQSIYYLIGILAFSTAIVSLLILTWTFDLYYLKYFTTSFVIFVLMGVFDPYK